MVQGKCIKLYPLKILTLFIVILLSNISQAISWLPNEGEYKFISSFLFIDEEEEEKWVIYLIIIVIIKLKRDNLLISLYVYIYIFEFLREKWLLFYSINIWT